MYMLYINILLGDILIRMNKDPSSLETCSQALIPWNQGRVSIWSVDISAPRPKLHLIVLLWGCRVNTPGQLVPGNRQLPGSSSLIFPDSAHRPCSFCNSSWEIEWSGSGQGQGSQEVGLGVPGDLKGPAEAPLGSCPGWRKPAWSCRKADGSQAWPGAASSD